MSEHWFATWIYAMESDNVTITASEDGEVTIAHKELKLVRATADDVEAML